jgi:hypothetical protein
MARGSNPTGNSDPLRIRASGRQKTSYQVRDFVFCRDCEQLLSRNGEDYVMKLVTRRDLKFPLLEKLISIPPTAVGENWKSYSASDTPFLDRAKIAYFALSIFWRASVHSWTEEHGEKVSLNLGKRYNEEIRRYLLNEAPIPTNARLQVAVCSDQKSQISFFMPRENEKVKDRSVGVLVRGLFLMFRITRTPPLWASRLSMINTGPEWISIWDCVEQGVWRLGDGA